jgi:hypothetical protein
MSDLLTIKEVRDMAQKSLDEVNEEIEKNNHMHALIIEKLMRKRALFETIIETTAAAW